MSTFIASDNRFGDPVLEDFFGALSDTQTSEQIMIQLWNDVVENTDNVIVLGNFSNMWRGYVVVIINRLHGNLFFMYERYQEWMKESIVYSTHIRQRRSVRFIPAENQIRFMVNNTPVSFLLSYYYNKELHLSHSDLYYVHGGVIQTGYVAGSKSLNVGVKNVFHMIGEIHPLRVETIYEIMRSGDETERHTEAH